MYNSITTQDAEPAPETWQGLDRRKKSELVTESMDSLTMTLEIQCKFFFSMLSSPCVTLGLCVMD